MCRCDVSPGAEPLLVEVMVAMRDRLAEWVGMDPEDVVIGPIDFGPARTVDGEHTRM